QRVVGDSPGEVPLGKMEQRPGHAAQRARHPGDQSEGAQGGAGGGHIRYSLDRPAWKRSAISVTCSGVITRGGDTWRAPPPTARVSTPASRQALAARAGNVSSVGSSWMA